MSNTTPEIPEGYVMNARGQLVRESVMSEVDRLTDTLVFFACNAAIAEQNRLRLLRESTTKDADALADLVLAEHGLKMGGHKGNRTLRTFNGQYKIEFVKQEYEVADDMDIAAAQTLIREFIDEGTQSMSADHRTVLDWAFKRNSDGRWDIRRLKDVTRLPIKHPKFGQAADIIIGAIRVGGVREYVRFYQRVQGSLDKYEPIHLDMAKL